MLAPASEQEQHDESQNIQATCSLHNCEQPKAACANMSNPRSLQIMDISIQADFPTSTVLTLTRYSVMPVLQARKHIEQEFKFHTVSRIDVSTKCKFQHPFESIYFKIPTNSLPADVL